MKTLPCGHCVVCRKCFVKTIQTAVTDRCLPLRCVVCRTKILRLKQQPPPQTVKSRLPQQASVKHPHHQASANTRHPDTTGTLSQRPKPATAGAGTMSKGLFAGPHARTPATMGCGTTRLPRPMHPLLIYPSEAGSDRSRAGSGAGAWSEDSVSTGVGARGSPLTVVTSSRRRMRHCAPSTAAVVHVSG